MAVEGLKGASVAADIIMWVITTIVFRDNLEVQFLYYTQEGFGSKFLRSTSFFKDFRMHLSYISYLPHSHVR